MPDTPRPDAISPQPLREDEDAEKLLRPRTLDEFVGQQKIKDNLRVFMTAALQRGEVLDHVLLSGPPGLGKCVTADSLILTARGWVPFSNLIPEGMAPDTSRPLEVDVYGLEGLEQTARVYASGEVPTCRLTTRSGFVIEGTPHHPVRVASSDGPRWKPLGQLSPDDHVAIGRGMNVWGERHQTTWTPEAPVDRRQRNERLVSHLHAELTEALGRPPATVELRKAYGDVLGTYATTPQQAARRLGLALTDGRTVNTVHPTLSSVSESVAAGKRVLTLDADLAYLLGAFVGDGHMERGGAFPAFVIPCEDAEMQAELRRVSRKCFGKTPRVKKYGDRAARLRFSQNQGKALLSFGLKAAGASGKTVPSAILTSPREVVVGFLQGLFDADGHARSDGAQLDTRSEALARQVQLLLANLGVIAHRSEKQVTGAPFWTLFVGGRDAVQQHPAYETLTALANPDVYWDRVADLSASRAEAFDFVVPGTHSFVANGFFNHNTTLAGIIAEEMGAKITTTSGPVLEKPANIAGVLTNLEEGDVLFIDEIHRLSSVVEEYLYSAMEDYRIDIVIDSGPNARSVQITLPPFTLIGATTRKGLLTSPLRARFGIDFRYDYYTADLLQEIARRSAGILGVEITEDGAFEIARRSRGTPRVANRLLRRTRDFAEVEGDGRITRAIADHALNKLDVDEEGLDDMDTRILLTLIENFGGGPTGLNNLSVSVGEDAGTIEEVYEPYLIQEGFLERTPRGRVASRRAYAHFDIRPPHEDDLFGQR